jgi:hypothetical protein
MQASSANPAGDSARGEARGPSLDAAEVPEIASEGLPAEAFKPKRSYEKWSPEEDQELIRLRAQVEQELIDFRAQLENAGPNGSANPAGDSAREEARGPSLDAARLHAQFEQELIDLRAQLENAGPNGSANPAGDSAREEARGPSLDAARLHAQVEQELIDFRAQLENAGPNGSANLAGDSARGEARGPSLDAAEVLDIASAGSPAEVPGSGRSSGRWSPEENQALIRLHAIYRNKWRLIADLMPLDKNGKHRDGPQCLSRWTIIGPSLDAAEVPEIASADLPAEAFKPKRSSGKWSPEEDQALIDLHARLGNKWKRIADLMPLDENGEHRDGDQCLGRWTIIGPSLDAAEGPDIASAGLSAEAFKPKQSYEKWSPEEDQALIGLHAIHENKWELIASLMPSNGKGKYRNGHQCQKRFKNALNPSINHAPWIPEEDRELIRLHAIHGNKWELIASLMPRDGEGKCRDGRQCQKRFKHALNPSINHAPWIPGEDQELTRLHAIYGNDWVKIASLMAHIREGKHRDGHQCRVRWITIEGRMQASSANPAGDSVREEARGPSLDVAEVSDIVSAGSPAEASGSGRSSGRWSPEEDQALIRLRAQFDQKLIRFRAQFEQERERLRAQFEQAVIDLRAQLENAGPNGSANPAGDSAREEAEAMPGGALPTEFRT